MSSQPIHDFLLLNIAEQADLQTISALTRTNKFAYQLLRNHERSIVKRKLAAYLLPPLGNILSSRGDTRDVIYLTKFEALQEMALRDKRMGEILDAIHSRRSTDGHIRWDDAEFWSHARRLSSSYRRSMYLLDGVADLEAQIDVDAAGPNFEETRVDALRQAQLKYLESLETLDLVFLNELVYIASVCYRQKQQESFITDPEMLEKKIALKEAVLRNGSIFLHDIIVGSGPISSASADRLHEALREVMIRKEGGPALAPGLHTTLLKVLGERLREIEEKRAALKCSSTGKWVSLHMFARRHASKTLGLYSRRRRPAATGVVKSGKK